MKLRLNANAIITNSEGKFLIIKLKGGNFAGGLSFPGGGVNPGEFSHETARREIMEETGIDVKNELRPFGFCELRSEEKADHRVVLLLHSTAEGEPKETDTGFAKWMTYEEAKDGLIDFATETLKIWKEKKIHFKLDKT